MSILNSVIIVDSILENIFLRLKMPKKGKNKHLQMQKQQLKYQKQQEVRAAKAMKKAEAQIKKEQSEAEKKLSSDQAKNNDEKKPNLKLDPLNPCCESLPLIEIPRKHEISKDSSRELMKKEFPKVLLRKHIKQLPRLKLHKFDSATPRIIDDGELPSTSTGSNNNSHRGPSAKVPLPNLNYPVWQKSKIQPLNYSDVVSGKQPLSQLKPDCSASWKKHFSEPIVGVSAYKQRTPSPSNKLSGPRSGMLYSDVLLSNGPSGSVKDSDNVSKESLIKLKSIPQEKISTPTILKRSDVVRDDKCFLRSISQNKKDVPRIQFPNLNERDRYLPTDENFRSIILRKSPPSIKIMEQSSESDSDSKINTPTSPIPSPIKTPPDIKPESETESEITSSDSSDSIEEAEQTDFSLTDIDDVFEAQIETISITETSLETTNTQIKILNRDPNMEQKTEQKREPGIVKILKRPTEPTPDHSNYYLEQNIRKLKYLQTTCDDKTQLFRLNIPKYNFTEPDLKPDAYPRFLCQFDDEHYLQSEKVALLGLKLAMGNKTLPGNFKC